MLVVVEDRDIALFLQLLLDLKAAGRADIFQVDAAEGTADLINDVYDLIHVLGAYAERESVHAAELLEQHAFAFHNGHARFGADIAETQHRGAVGNHGHHIPAAGELPALIVIFLNFKAGLRNAGGIGEGEGVLAVHLGAGNHFYLALPFAVESEGFFSVIHNYSPLL